MYSYVGVARRGLEAVLSEVVPRNNRFINLYVRCRTTMYVPTKRPRVASFAWSHWSSSIGSLHKRQTMEGTVFLCSTVHRCLEIDNSKINNMHTWINMCFLKCSLRWISLFFPQNWNTIEYSGFDEICENVMNAKAETVLASSLSLFCHVKQICSSVKLVCYWLQWGQLGGHIIYFTTCVYLYIYIYILQQYMRWGVDPIGSIEKMRKFKAARLRE